MPAVLSPQLLCLEQWPCHSLLTLQPTVQRRGSSAMCVPIILVTHGATSGSTCEANMVRRHHRCKASQLYIFILHMIGCTLLVTFLTYLFAFLHLFSAASHHRPLCVAPALHSAPDGHHLFPTATDAFAIYPFFIYVHLDCIGLCCETNCLWCLNVTQQGLTSSRWPTPKRQRLPRRNERKQGDRTHMCIQHGCHHRSIRQHRNHS